jgi:hypothetical protein
VRGGDYRQEIVEEARLRCWLFPVANGGALHARICRTRWSGDRIEQGRATRSTYNPGQGHELGTRLLPTLPRPRATIPAGAGGLLGMTWVPHP